MPKVELNANVLTVEERQYNGKTYRNAVVIADGKVLSISLGDGVALQAGDEQTLILELTTFGTDIRPSLRVVGIGK